MLNRILRLFPYVRRLEKERAEALPHQLQQIARQQLAELKAAIAQPSKTMAELMDEREVIDLRVTGGTVVVHPYGIVEYSFPTIQAICINASSKYFEHSGNGSDNEIPYITLSANDDTLHPYPMSPIRTDTEIYFDHLAGWNVFAVSAGKSLIRVCLVKPSI